MSLREGPYITPVLRPILRKKRENHDVKTLVASLVGLGRIQMSAVYILESHRTESVFDTISVYLYAILFVKSSGSRFFLPK